MRIVDRPISNRQFGSHQFLLVSSARGERPVQNSSGEQSPLDGVTRAPGMDHPLDRLQQVREVWVTWLRSLFEPGRQHARLPLDLESRRNPADKVGQHQYASQQAVVVLKQEERRLISLSQVALTAWQNAK